jgi:hypothetical protein
MERPGPGLLTIVDELQDEIDSAYAVAVAVEGLKEGGHELSPNFGDGRDQAAAA